MSFEFKIDDAKNLDFGKSYPEEAPEPETRKDNKVIVDNALATINMKTNAETPETSILMYKIASYQIDCLSTALRYSFKVKGEANQEIYRTHILKDLGYFQFITNPLIHGDKFHQVIGNAMVQNMDTVFTLNAFLNGKLLRQVVIDLGSEVPITAIDINFHYAQDKIIELRQGLLSKSINIFESKQPFHLDPDKRDMVDRLVLNIGDLGEVIDSLETKIIEVTTPQGKKRAMESYSPIGNPDSRSIIVFDAKETREEGRVRFADLDGKLHAFMDASGMSLDGKNKQIKFSRTRNFAAIPDIFMPTQDVFDLLANPKNLLGISTITIDTETEQLKSATFIGLDSNFKGITFETNTKGNAFAHIIYDGQKFAFKDIKHLPIGDGRSRYKLPNGIELVLAFSPSGLVESVEVSGGKLQA